MMHRLALLALPLCLALLPVSLGLPDEAVGRVVSVISGDSLGIEMLIADEGAKGVDSVKLADIAAPSTITAEGKAAKSYSLSLLKNKMVYLDINNNTTSRRNKWNQLVCVIYLVDPEFRPVWPPVNRIIVDNGYAKRSDNQNDEFNSSAWWQKSPVLLPSKKGNLLTAIIEKRVHPEQMFLVEPLPSPADVVPINSSSISAKDSSVSATTSVTAASDKIREIPMLGVKKGASSSNVAKVKSSSDKARETFLLGSKGGTSTSDATEDTSASRVVPANSSSVAVNDSTISLGVPLNSTSRFVMENSTSHEVLVNTTSRVVPGISKSNEAKRDPRSGSILEKDATSGRISIGYRK